MQPGTTPRQAGTADLYQHTARMAVRPRRVLTTPIRVCMVQRVKVRTLTAIGAVRSRYAATSGHRPRIEQARKGLRQAFGLLKEHAVPVTAVQMGIVASSRKARMTICTPARTEMFTARTPAAVGRSMTTVAGRIRLPGRLPIARMQPGHKEPRPSSAQLRARRADLPRHNSQLSLRGQFNSSIAMLRRAKQVRSAHSSSSDLRVRGAQEGPHAGDLSESCETTVIRSETMY